MRLSHRHLATACAGLPAVLAIGCGDSLPTAGPSAQLGAIEIRVSTSVETPADHDPDGYALRIDGGPDWRIGTNETRSFGPLPAGVHQVLLGGLATRCSVYGDNPRWVEVNRTRLSPVVFGVTCRAITDSGEGQWDY